MNDLKAQIEKAVNWWVDQFVTPIQVPAKATQEETSEIHLANSFKQSLDREDILNFKEKLRLAIAKEYAKREQQWLNVIVAHRPDDLLQSVLKDCDISMNCFPRHSRTAIREDAVMVSSGPNDPIHPIDEN